jgi:hypothetical protein
MNVLDENVRDDQRALLRRWRIPFRQIGKELAVSGVQDPDVIALLHTLKRPTLFTQDRVFFRVRSVTALIASRGWRRARANPVELVRRQAGKVDGRAVGRKATPNEPLRDQS